MHVLAPTDWFSQKPRRAYRGAGAFAPPQWRAALPFALALLLALGLPGGAGLAAELPAGLAVAESGRALEVIDGDTLVLADGRQVRLVGIQAPKLPLGRRNFTAWPFAEEAKAALEVLALGRDIRLAYGGGSREDRHGRALAQIATPEGLWIQGRLLELGLARVYSFADNREGVAEMLALERAARGARRGIWSHPFYALRDAGDTAALWPLLDSFQLLEGRVAGVHETRSATYLNFGEDWRSDFTLVVRSSARPLFREAGLDLKALEGKRLRVRGWLGAYNGPSMELTHPEQLEVLEP